MKLSAIWRPGRAAGEAATGQGITLQPYRGYGSREEVFLIGRVFRQPWPDTAPASDDLGRRSARYRPRRSAPARRRRRAGARLASAGPSSGSRPTATAISASTCGPAEPAPADRLLARRWTLALLAAGAGHGRGRSCSCRRERCRYVVISDIDDTVMHTGVASKAEDAVAAVHAGCREPGRLPRRGGPAARAARGRSGRRAQPDALRLARALEHLRGAGRVLPPARHPGRPDPVPARMGPDPAEPAAAPRQGPQARADPQHAGALPRPAVRPDRRQRPARSRDLRAQIVREHPGRVLAIYIRNVSRDPGRLRAIEALAGEVAGAGSSLVLAGGQLGHGRACGAPWADHTGSHCHRAGNIARRKGSPPWRRATSARSRGPPRAKPAPRSSTARWNRSSTIPAATISRPTSWSSQADRRARNALGRARELATPAPVQRFPTPNHG